MRNCRAIILASALAATSCGTGPESPIATVVAGAAAKDIALSADVIVVSARVPARTTLAAMLLAQKVAAAEVAAIVARAGAVFDLRRVRASQPFRIERVSSGTIRRFEYEIDGDRVLRVARAGADLVASVDAIPKTRRVAHVSARIDRESPSLVSALAAAGETIDLALSLAGILGGEIDFSTELQRGDEMRLTVEKQYRDLPARPGEDHQGSSVFAGYGPVLAVEFVNAGRRVRAVRYAPEGGPPGYYDERGVSMRRFFLASPLKFQPVVTSGFSHARLHPVLREVRAHLGVDYRAPAGSPVVAVADGVVVSAGVSGGAGRMVHLRHSNGFETEYLHLSSIAVRPGARVQQGELIGRVGSTGLATGAHLDYRVKRNGVFVNPVTAHRSLPPADPIPSAQMASFALARDRAFDTIAAPPVALAADAR